MTELQEGWKVSLMRFLVNIGLAPEAFTGEITINCNQGGVTDTWVKIRKK